MLNCGTASQSYTLSDVAIPLDASSILVLLEGAGGEAMTGVRSSSKWIFPKIGVPQKWMVNNGKPYSHGVPLFSEISKSSGPKNST